MTKSQYQVKNRLDLVCEDLIQYYKALLGRAAANTDTIIDFILAAQTENNLTLNSRKSYIYTLTAFSLFHKNKSYKEIERHDIVDFLNSFRKAEPLDPSHRWIGTYNLYRAQLMRFFKWLHFPDMEQKKRPNPACIGNIPSLKRKEKSIYKPTDLWSSDDDLLFLKYCPFKRDACYHAISTDSSCRPHELLKTKLKEVVFKMAGDRQYAEVLVNGKTGSRHIPLINSLPYLKAWLDDHPQKNNPNSPLICSIGKTMGRKMTIGGLGKIYERNKILFQNLLANPGLSPEDKLKIKELLKKPWNSYIRRHSALTEKSKILKEGILRQHAGWVANSSMNLRYIHYFGNEANESILEAYGLKPRAEELDKLKPKQCPNCNESCKIDAKFCPSCRMVLSYDSYTETVDAVEQKESEVKLLQEKYQKDMKEMRQDMEIKFQKILEKIDVRKPHELSNARMYCV